MADYDKSKNKNTRHGGTRGIEIPKGTDAQREGTTGQVRYNTQSGLAEVYSSLGWGAFGTPPPDLQSINPTTYNGEGGTSITLTGANFTADAAVTFKDQSNNEYPAASVTFNSSSELVATTPQDFTVAQGPLDIIVVQASGTSTGTDILSTGAGPVWSTAANLGTVVGGASTAITVVATDADAGATITYSLVSGGISGITVNSNGSWSGTYPNVASNTTYNPIIRATDNAGNTADRTFSIVVQPAFMSVSISGSSSETTNGDFKYATFNGAGTFTVNAVGADPTYGNKVRYLIIGGGGGGSGFGSQGPSFPGDGNFGSGGGGGAGGMLDSSGFNQTVTAQGYPIGVGGGGPGGVGSQPGNPGGNSTAFGVTATGGGGGGRQDHVGLPGGSGGGSGTDGQGFNDASSGVPGQGNAGGRGADTQTGWSGGGGGAGGAGTQTRNANTVGLGGIGVDSDVTGSTVRYAGGGGGARYPGGPHTNTAPPGGGGGGSGSQQDSGPGSNGTNGLGGGGGGANDQDPRESPEHFGGTGGNGVVIIRYKFQ